MRPSSVQLLAHADLLAVEQRRRAGEAEHEAVGEPDAALVAAEHRRQPAAEAAAVELHVRLRARTRRTPPARSAPLSLSSVSSSWLRSEHRPLRVVRRAGPARERAAQRTGVAAGQREPGRLHRREVEQQRHLVAVLVAEERARLRVRQVDLAEQDRVAGAAAEERAQVAQVVVRVGQRLRAALDPAASRSGTARRPPGTRDSPSSIQKPMTFGRSRRAPAGWRRSRSGWLAVEAVQVVLASPCRSLRPDAGLAVGEDDVAGLLRPALVAPDVPVAVRRRRRSARADWNHGCSRARVVARPGRRSPAARGPARVRTNSTKSPSVPSRGSTA